MDTAPRGFIYVVRLCRHKRARRSMQTACASERGEGAPWGAPSRSYRLPSGDRRLQHLRHDPGVGRRISAQLEEFGSVSNRSPPPCDLFGTVPKHPNERSVARQFRNPCNDLKICTLKPTVLVVCRDLFLRTSLETRPYRQLKRRGCCREIYGVVPLDTRGRSIPFVVPQHDASV